MGRLRKRAESALISVVATCYLLGVSTRWMDKLVRSLGITSPSKSQVSRMAADLDEQVAASRFFADLIARGLAGVKLVTSDAHAGLVEAIGVNLPGEPRGNAAAPTTPPTS